MTIVIVLVVAGILLWLINAYIPMEAVIKRMLNIVVIVVLAIWLLKELGLFDYLSKVHT